MYTPDCLWHLLPTSSLSKASRYEIRPSLLPLSPSRFPRVSPRARTHVRKRSHTDLFYLICLSSSYLRALRRCSPTTLNTHVPAKAFRSLSETSLRAEVARCSHPLEEIRFSNPSRHRRLLRRRHFAILLPSLLHGKDTAITTASCFVAKALNKVQYKSFHA